MNAPPPQNSTHERRPATALSCAKTRLSVPECSCLDCLEGLIRANAPALLARHAQPLS